MFSQPSFTHSHVRSLTEVATLAIRIKHRVARYSCAFLFLSFTNLNFAVDTAFEIQVISKDQAISLPERSEAEQLAERLLMEESTEPLLDLNELQRLSSEIQTGLNAVRDFEPSMSAVTAREQFRSDMLIIDLRSDLGNKAKEITEDASGKVEFITGFKDFDELNRKLGLFAIQYLEHVEIFFFYFANPINVPVALIQYSEIGGVEFAEPDINLVVWADIDVYRSNGSWTFVFKPPPSADLTEPIEHKMYFYSVKDGKVDRHWTN